MRKCGVTKNVVFRCSCRYTVYHTENSNHLHQNIGIIWRKRSMLVNNNTAECNVSQEKKKLSPNCLRQLYRHKRNFLGQLYRYEKPACTHSRIKGQGGPGQFSLQGPYDVSHDVIFCKNYVCADLQRSPLLFPVVENVLAQLYIQLAARRELKLWGVFLLLKTFRRLETDSARNNIHPNNKQKPEIQKKHRKTNMTLWPVRLSVNGASNLMSGFSPTFSDALVNATLV